MSTLLLTSAGMLVGEEVKKAIGREPTQARVVFVVTATNPDKEKTYLNINRQQLQEAGYKTVDLDIAGKTEEEVRAALANTDTVFVSGGNTFYLLKHVRESGFDRVIQERIAEGMPYVGVSAGSIIMGPTIEPATWGSSSGDKNMVGLTDLTSLGLVPFLIHVHYEENELDELKQRAQTASAPIRILTDRQAFLVRDGNVQLVGEQPEIVI